VISQKIGDKPTELTSLVNLTAIMTNQAKFAEAKTYGIKGLTLASELKDTNSQSRISNDLIISYLALQEYKLAKDLLLQNLVRNQQQKNAQLIATDLENLGLVHNQLGQYSVGLNYYKQALEAWQKLNNLSGIAIAHRGMAVSFSNLEQTAMGIEQWQKALTISQKANDYLQQALTWSSIGNYLKQSQQPQLAVVFYKQSVNTLAKSTGAIAQQQRLVNQEIYAPLTNILLGENRLDEATNILYIWHSYLNPKSEKIVTIPARQTLPTNLLNLPKTIELLPIEQKIISADLSNLTKQNITAQDLKIDTWKFTAELQALLTKSDNIGIIFPVVLPEQLELILLTQTGTPIRQTIKISAEQLVEKWQKLGGAEKIYDSFIQPLENEINKLGIKTIIFLPNALPAIPQSN
ncbi:MAG: hypothetical protein ACRDB1_16840, partial [Microcoleaceae cyanobacterium]